MGIKNFMKASIWIPLVIGLAAGALFSLNAVIKANAKLKIMTTENLKLQADYSEFKSKYEGLVVDRNNVLTQTKILLGEKGKYADLDEAHKTLEKRYQNQLKRKGKLFQYDKKLAMQKLSLMQAYDQIAAERKALQERISQLEKEKEQLKTDYEKKVEETPVYAALDTEAKQLRGDNRKLTDTVKNQDSQLKKDEAKIKSQSDELSKIKKDAAAVKKERDGLKNEKKSLIVQNKDLVKTAKVAPSKFRSLAEENRQMLRETADMHYNLGVFYMKQKNYAMAIKELTRALDFNPDNPKVHYNLGVLYADEYENHPEAIAHLKRFLELDPKAKEADEARNYLMVREAYGDKMQVSK